MEQEIFTLTRFNEKYEITKQVSSTSNENLIIIMYDQFLKAREEICKKYGITGGKIGFADREKAVIKCGDDVMIWRITPSSLFGNDFNHNPDDVSDNDAVEPFVHYPNGQDGTPIVENDVRKMWREVYDRDGKEPVFANCRVEYKDDGNSFDTLICLFDGCELEEGEDEGVFYYCSGLDDLFSLCDRDGMEDFVITEIYGFQSDIYG